MIRTGDPMLEVFRHRNDPAAREAYVAAQEKDAEARRAGFGGASEIVAWGGTATQPRQSH